MADYRKFKQSYEDIAPLINALIKIFENKKIQNTSGQSLKGGLITGCSAFAGALILGPIGLALGGAVGGAVAAIKSKNTFNSIPTIIREMTYEEKQDLCSTVVEAFKHVQFTTLLSLATMILGNLNLKNLAISVVENYLKKHHKLTV